MQFSDKEIQAAEVFSKVLKSYLDETSSDTFKKPFLSEKKHIEKTKLYKLLKLFPKGAALHLHWVSAGLNESLTNYIVDHPTIFYQFLEDNHATYHKGAIRYWKEDPGKSWIRIDKLLSEVGKENFVQDTLAKMTMTAEDEVGSSEKRWKHFQAIFDNYYFGLTFFAPLARYYHLQMVEAYVEDNIQYAEYRCPFTYFYDENEKKFSQREAAEFFARVEKEAVEKFGSDKWVGAKWIQESMRMYDHATVRKEMEICYELQNDLPDTVMGFDLVGEEDTGHSCEYFANDVNEMKQRAREEGKKFNVVFHLGETNHPTKNIEAGIKLDTLRIGHGYNLMRFPDQMNLVKQRDIPLEVCPVSNRVLGLIRDPRNHPMNQFLPFNVPIVISSDDPSIFGYKGVTHDFFMLATAVQISLPQLKQIALNSIKYAYLDDESRDGLRSLWEKKYDEWLDTVIRDF